METCGYWITDRDIAAGAGRMIAAEPSVQRRIGLDGAVMDYVARAMAFL